MSNMDRYEVKYLPTKKDNSNRGKLFLNMDFLLSSSATQLFHLPPQRHQYHQGRQHYHLTEQIGGFHSIPASPSGTISSSSSLDTCLGSFPFRSSSRLGVIEMTNDGRDGVQALFSALPSQFQSKQALVQGSFESTSTSPLYSALEASECSMLQSPSSDAVSSSDDAMCSSPLMAEVKGRRFQVGNLEGPLGMTCKNLSSSIDSRQLEAINQWQEGVSPPVPAIPPRFQIETTQPIGWTRSEDDLPQCQIQSEIVRVNEGVTIKPIIINKDHHRTSMTSSSRKATTIDMSEQSLDTCINSIGTYASTLKSQEGNSSSNNVHYENTQMMHHGNVAPTSNGLLIPARSAIRNGSFAYNARTSESNSSLSASKDYRPQTATRRIAFSPSVRIGKCVDSNDHPSMMDSLHGQSTAEECQIPISQPIPLPTLKGIRDIRPNEGGRFKKKILRPLTAPDANGQARPSFKNMLRPLSRQNREGGAPAKSFSFGRPMSRGRGAEEPAGEVFDRPVLIDHDVGQGEAGRFFDETERANPNTETSTENRFGNKSERETNHASMDTHRRSLLDGCPTYAETMAARYETAPMQSGGSRLAPKEDSIRFDTKNSGVIRRVVSRLTEAFSSSNNKINSGAHEEEGESTVVDEVQLHRSFSKNWQSSQQKRPPTREKYRELVKQSKSFLRPMTAPYAGTNENTSSSRPMSRKGGEGTESKRPNQGFQMVSRCEPTSQPSILMGQGKQFRSCEQLRDRHIDQEEQQQQQQQQLQHQQQQYHHRQQQQNHHRLNTARPFDRDLPSIPSSQFSHSTFSADWERPQRQAGMSPSSSCIDQGSRSTNQLVEPPISSFTGRVALVPITRVSKDELKRMQPVRIVKCADNDGENKI